MQPQSLDMSGLESSGQEGGVADLRPSAANDAQRAASMNASPRHRAMQALQRMAAGEAIAPPAAKPVLQPRGARLDGPAATGDGVAQRASIRHNNPHFKGEYKPPALDPAMAGIVDALSNAVDAESALLNDEIGRLKDNHSLFDGLAAIWAGRANRKGENFARRVARWLAHGKGQPHKEAGYMVEHAADQVAKGAGVKTQVTLGNARPDYMIESADTHVWNDQTHFAHGLVDATSQAEATKGHIVGKVMKFPKKVLFNFPHLWDVYYAKIGFGKVAGRAALTGDVADGVRRKRQADLELAEERKKVLRSATKKDKGDTSKAPTKAVAKRHAGRKKKGPY
jgi:hypothetical protein